MCIFPEYPEVAMMRNREFRVTLLALSRFCSCLVRADSVEACQECCCPAGGCLLLALLDELSGKIKPLIDCLNADFGNT